MIPRFAPTYGWSDLAHGLEEAGGDEVEKELAARLAALHGVKHVFLVASARVGLYLLLRAWNRPGGVILPAYDCIVVPEAIRFAGYSPVMVDIDLSTGNMSAAAVRQALSRSVSAVFATHLFGIPWDIHEIEEAVRGRGVLLVEDAAAALGAELRGRRVGGLADAGVISFHSTKVVSGEGGGAVLTSNDELASRVRALLGSAGAPSLPPAIFLRALARKSATSALTYWLTRWGYGLLDGERMFETVKPRARMPRGYLARCSRFSSALVLRQLLDLERNVTRRRSIVRLYQTSLAGVPGLDPLAVPADCAPAWIQFPVRARDKAALYRHMQRHGVDLSWSYRYSCADSYRVDCPQARIAANTVLGLPTHPRVTDEQARRACEAARSFGRSAAACTGLASAGG